MNKIKKNKKEIQKIVDGAFIITEPNKVPKLNRIREELKKSNHK